jgi:hypothetical protein
MLQQLFGALFFLVSKAKKKRLFLSSIFHFSIDSESLLLPKNKRQIALFFSRKSLFSKTVCFNLSTSNSI